MKTIDERSATVADIEARLRELWTRHDVPEDRQTAMLAQIVASARCAFAELGRRR